MKQTKAVLLMILGLLVAAAGFAAAKWIPDPVGVMRALPYLALGVGCGLFGHQAGDLLAKRAVRNNPEIAREIEIAQMDERNVQLAEKSKARAFDQMQYSFGAVLLTIALMGADTMVVLLLAACYIYVIASSLYYRVKLEKEM